MKAAVAASSQVISSAANPLLKEIRRAVRQNGLTGDGCVVAESFHLVEEALRSGCECEIVIASENVRTKVEAMIAATGRDVTLRSVENTLFPKIAATETTQGVIALVRPPAWTLDDLYGRRPLVVVLDGVQDPGNAGSIVRAAEAFGASGVFFLRDTAGPFNPKTLRAAAGSLFRLPYVCGVERDVIRDELRERKLQVLAGLAESGDPPDRIDWTVPSALIVGSEAHGVSAALRHDAKAVRIPTQRVESLNASIAAAILLYEASRQRSRSQRPGWRPAGTNEAVRNPAGKAPA